MRSRIFNIMQYACHKDTGEVLITEARITETLNKYKSIKQWAWIAHDHDIDDKGKLKPLHYHIVLNMGNTVKDTSDVARWFGIADNFVGVPKGHKGRGMDNFRDCVEYLPHDNFPERGQYPDEAVHANFDWRAFVSSSGCASIDSRRVIVEGWIKEIMQGQLSLDACREQDSVLYVLNLQKLRNAQSEYLRSLPAPAIRLNFCITGDSSMGKSTLAKALARSMFPGVPDRDCYHVVGSTKTPFDGYTGQPVIIWDDARPLTLLETLGDRDNLLKVLDSHPSEALQHVKYGVVNLVNKINIFTTVTSYSDFLDGLAGQYVNKYGELIKSESRVQSYRRFPVIFRLDLSDFVMLLNKGWLDGQQEFLEFAETMRFVCGMWRLRDKYQSQGLPMSVYEPRAREREAQMLAPAIEKINALVPPEEVEGVDYTAALKAADDDLDAEGWGRCEIIDRTTFSEPVQSTFNWRDELEPLYVSRNRKN